MVRSLWVRLAGGGALDGRQDRDRRGGAGAVPWAVGDARWLERALRDGGVTAAADRLAQAPSHQLAGVWLPAGPSPNFPIAVRG